MAIGRAVVKVMRVLTCGRVVVSPLPVDGRLWPVGLWVVRYLQTSGVVVVVGCIFSSRGDLGVL